MNAKLLACKGDDFAECIECAKHMIQEQMDDSIKNK